MYAATSSKFALLAILALTVLAVDSAEAQQRRVTRFPPPDLALTGISELSGPGRMLVPSTAGGDVVVQSGEIAQSGEVEVVLDQFDDQRGTRRLEFVQIDLFSSIFGGFTTSGTGGNVFVRATFDQDYLLGSSMLAGTRCVFMDSLTNDDMTAFSFFVNDTDQALLTQPNALAPWIGTGQVTLTSLGTLDWDIQPLESLVDFGAGLSATYTVTYGFSVIDCRADLDGDGTVTTRDLRIVISAFGNPGGPEDLDENGIVNARDLQAVVSSFGSCP